MEERNQLPPPPPTYPVTADIPPQSPYHRSPAPSSRRNGGILGGLAAAAAAAFAYGKWALLLIFKIPAAGPVISFVVSFGGYALFYAPWFAVAPPPVICVHVMDQVIRSGREACLATAATLHRLLAPA